MERTCRVGRPPKRRQVAQPPGNTTLTKPPSTSPPTVARRLLDRLEGWGVSKVFLVPGAHIDPLVLALSDSDRIQAVPCCHETSAGFMAHGHAMATGGIGVCAAIGGPGASNLLSAAICARAERGRVLCLTGDVPTWSASLQAFQDGGSRGGRDQALFAKALDASRNVPSAEGLDAALDEVRLALGGTPPGPAHLRIPVDVLAAPAAPDHRRPAGPAAAAARPAGVHPDPGLAVFLAKAGPRVAMLVGEECNDPEAAQALRGFAEAYGIPVATTLGAKGVLPEDHPLSLGCFGFGGMRRAHAALLEAPPDLLLVLGADLGERNTLAWDPRLRVLGARLVAIAASLPRNAFTRRFTRIRTEARKALLGLADLDRDARGNLQAGAGERRAWVDSLSAVPQEYPEPATWHGEPRLHPGRIVAELRRALPRDARLVIDAGSFRPHAAHHWRAYGPGQVLSASLSAPMGWGIAAAIGAAFHPQAGPIAVLTGDGCMRMHGMEISTAARFALPVLFVVCNNAALGSLYFRYRHAGPRAEALARLPDVDWAAFATLLGVPARRVDSLAGLREALAAAREGGGPFLIDVSTQLEGAEAGPVPAPLASSMPPRQWPLPARERR